MRSWWANVVKDYFAFTRKERRALFIIFIVSVSFYLISRYLPVPQKQFDQRAFEKELAQLTITVDTNHRSYTPYNSPGNDFTTRHDKSNPPAKRELFAFDPNTLDANGWKRLGLRDRTIQTVQNFIAKGFRFKQPEDIRKIYGLRPAEADQLVPYVRIASIQTVAKTASDFHFSVANKTSGSETYRTKIIDINLADTTDFISLPGIGAKLAARIVNFRQKLGGFHSVQQVAETYGIPDTTFKLIKARLQCINPDVVKININTAGAAEIKRHPYFSWNIANAIVNYRAQHGNYTSIEDLHKIEIITDDLFNKIAPYLTTS